MPPGFSGMDLLRMTASMALVLALMGALLYLLKRMQARVGAQSSSRRLKLMESLSLNTRHKIAWIEMDGHTVLVGVSPAQLTCLAHWKDGVSVPTAMAQGTQPAWPLPGAHHEP